MGRLLVIPETLKKGPRNLRQGSQREMTLRDSSTDTEPGSGSGGSASVFLQDYGLKFNNCKPPKCKSHSTDLHPAHAGNTVQVEASNFAWPFSFSP